jgi:hypothetical protein
LPGRAGNNPRAARRRALGFKARGDERGRYGGTDDKEGKRDVSTKQLDNNPGYLLATLHGDLKEGDHEYVKLDDEIRE